jgi:hypothetical protein
VFINSERLKIMNTHDEQSTIDRAANALQQLTGQRVELVDRAPKVPGGEAIIADGTLVIGQHEFLFDVKSALHLKTLGFIKPSNRGTHPPVVVVSSHISTAIGQELQKRGIYYLDTAGNAFIRASNPDLFILIKGQRLAAAERNDTKRAFQRSGLRLLYHLLDNPELLQAPYRTLAAEASLSLGSVSAIISDLKQLDLLREEGDKRRWLDAPQVLRRWIDGYGAMLRPKLAHQCYRWRDGSMSQHGWQQLPLGIDSWWGGEPAANLLLNGYLLPEHFTLYSNATRGELMRRFQLVPDANGKVEVLSPFETTSFQYRPQSKAVSPLLTYADLFLSADPRNREVAHLLHEQYLNYLT